MARLVFLAFAMIAQLGCRQPDGTDKTCHIQFVLPTTFRGAFVIRADDKIGMFLDKKNDSYTLVIPKTGTLLTRGPNPLKSWHVASATFTDKKRLPIEKEAKGPNEIALWYLGTRKDGSTWFFVGTRREYRALDDTAPNFCVGGIQ